jgi:ATPase subunit of ABC transporter with duplicated ATPase domains
MTKALLQIAGATIVAPGGRPLFADLGLRLGRERVALVGRNGVGKSTLLDVLAGEADAARGEVRTWGRRHYVPQSVPGRTLSPGERRKCALLEARASGADVLLLDEPTEDLDDDGVAWLRAWLAGWTGGAIVASHDRRLLADFRHFFVASESGCRYLHGTLADVDAELEREHDATEQRYAQGLHRLATYEEHIARVTRRRARKKRFGRCRELDRGTPKVRLNQKRDYAQVKHGRMRKIREARLAEFREWAKSTRRALRVTLPLDLPAPDLPARDAGTRGEPIIARGVSAVSGGRTLFASIDLRVGRKRVAVVGPNGAGKTTLLEVLVGRRAPASGSVTRESARIGSVAQGGADWMRGESLVEHLAAELPSASAAELAQIVVDHRFPLALAERPMRSLSPGERTRAALIALFRRSPAPDVLVLDEPTYSLDLVGQRAVTRALRAWPGGLVVASHDRALLGEIGIETWIDLGP